MAHSPDHKTLVILVFLIYSGVHEMDSPISKLHFHMNGKVASRQRTLVCNMRKQSALFPSNREAVDRAIGQAKPPTLVWRVEK